MTEQITSQVVQLLVQVVVLVFVVLGSIVLHKAQGYLAKLKQGKQTSIVADLAYNVANLAEAQLKGGMGADKLNYAVQKLSTILASKKINVTADELHAAIETAVAHLPKTFVAEAAPVVEAQPIANVVTQVTAEAPAAPEAQK